MFDNEVFYKKEEENIRLVLIPTVPLVRITPYEYGLTYIRSIYYMGQYGSTCLVYTRQVNSSSDESLDESDHSKFTPTPLT